MAYRCALKALHTYLPCETTPSLKLRELVSTLCVQRSEDARNLTSLRARRRSPGDLEQPPGSRRRKFFCGSVLRDRGALDPRRKTVEVCDVVRAPKSFRIEPQRKHRIFKRMPGGRRCRATHARAPREAARSVHFHSFAERRSRGTYPCSAVWQSGAHKPHRRHSHSALFSLPWCFT